jgi:hypothetical protein
MATPTTTRGTIMTKAEMKARMIASAGAVCATEYWVGMLQAKLEAGNAITDGGLVTTAQEKHKDTNASDHRPGCSPK